MYPLVSCGGEADSDSTHVISPRTLVQRQRVDPGSKSSSFEPSYWFSFSYRHLASRFTGLLGEQIQVPRLICNPNCVSRKHLSRESTGSQYGGKRVFFQRGLDDGESWELLQTHRGFAICTSHLNHSLLFSIQLFLPDVWKLLLRTDFPQQYSGLFHDEATSGLYSRAGVDNVLR